MSQVSNNFTLCNGAGTAQPKALVRRLEYLGVTHTARFGILEVGLQPLQVVTITLE